MVPYLASAWLFHVLPSDPLDIPCPSECYFQYLPLLTLDVFPANNPALISRRIDREVRQEAITKLPSSKWSCLHNHGLKIQPVLHFKWLLEKQRVKNKLIRKQNLTPQLSERIKYFHFSFPLQRIELVLIIIIIFLKKCSWWMFFLSLI